MFSAKPSIDGQQIDLGARVRQLRRERGLTLKALGRRAGLSHPFLSQVERGLAHPSMNSVERIAAALEVPVARLWAPPRSADAVRVVRADEGTTNALGVRELPGDPGSVALHEWSNPPRTWSEPLEGEPGEVTIYAARGALEVELNGTVHALAEGDALRFDGAVPHRLRRTAGPSTRALIVSQGR